MLTAVSTTSIDAYHGIVQTFEEAQELRILEHIRMHGPATIRELAEELGIEAGTVSARQNKLRKEKRLEWAPNKRVSRYSNVTCHVLQLPRGQGALFS